jgi:hypothetical protein
MKFWEAVQEHAMSKLACAMVVAALAPAGWSAVIATQHFTSLEEVQARALGGFEFAARGDTEKLRLQRFNPPGEAQVPFDLWNNNVPHAFRIVYNPDGNLGISVDDIFTVLSPVTVDARTNAILLTAFVFGGGRSVALENLKITVRQFEVHDVNDVARAPETDYLLIYTDLPLTGGFILSGTVRFSWTGALPPPTEQWFETTTLVVPEPVPLVLLLPALVGLRRPR